MLLPLTRRSVIAASVGLPLLRFAGAWAAPASAYRVGAFTVTPLRDGLFPLQPSMIPGADSEAGRALLTQAGLPPGGPSPEPVNAFLIRRGARHWLLDAGCGTVFGPGFDRVAAALAAEGVGPDQVDTVWLTHLHADHVGGLLTSQGRARFVEAELVVQEREAAFWSDEAARARAPAAMAVFFDTAQAVLAAYAGRVRRVSGRAELAPGVSFLPLPGHTPGHAGVLIEDGAERLLFWGDILHSRVLQMPHPDWTVIWDADPAEAIATRRHILDRAAMERLDVAGMHLATRGRIAREGSGYLWEVRDPADSNGGSR
ncbi:MBL fold metallo-hydrolase [Methylobacterium sp. R2-1]|uniref:MBL fold metallo-hydrolase n=1 Tax=Methylobacterium sp. R2-1 TaxID=2587064 RepID=UPI00161C8052|nr:MBL fold metallo-hydrolase [Methylobacterium sp. R2-1]MBB2960676.1 glyoxylase-like metal-dependent hydrolase (beta-lactamase superfamily II) [Methylobacterium sp. R2-1]